MRTSIAIALAGALLTSACGERRVAFVEPPKEVPAPSESGRLTSEGLIKVTDPARVFVGPIYHNTAKAPALTGDYCVDGKRHMSGAELRLGRLNLFGLVMDGLPRPGAWFVAYGERKQNLLARLEDKGACPAEGAAELQWRGDWTSDEGGYETRSEVLSKTDYIEAEGILHTQIFEVSAPEFRDSRTTWREDPEGRPLKDKRASVVVKNPFDVTWSGLEVIFHYESANKGKSMAHNERVKVDLKPGASKTLTRPLLIESQPPDVEGRVYLFDGAWLHSGQPEALGSPFFKL